MEEQISFARKYRATSLDTYIGNSKVKETVKRYLKNSKPQSILLTGNSGCGKTTMARVLVKEYLCEDRDSELGACGVCPTCVTVDDYIQTSNLEGLPDVYEFDATSEGAKGIGAMLESMEYAPMMGDWKIYIIDEVHKLSDGAMSKLLKPLEEPPEGVLIILCTTNPERVLDTIKNRCQLKLQVTKPTTKEIIEHLQNVCLHEGIEYDINGLRMVVSHADNVVRDSLNYLERVINTRGNAKAESVSKELQEVSDKILFDFFKAWKNDDSLAYSRVLYNIKTSYGFQQFLQSLVNFTKRGFYIINSIDVEGLSIEELNQYKNLFSQFSSEEITTVIRCVQKMDYGDIETNLIAFMCCERYSSIIKEEVTEVKVPEESIDKEVHFRNNNLEKIEMAKLQEGTKSLDSELQEVGFADVVDELFPNREKVD